MENKEIWLFGTYEFQGNPKALFVYLNRNKVFQSTIDSYWIADRQEQVDYIQSLGFQSYLMGSKKADELFSIANVYVVENFRESLPFQINPNITIANLWHGVGLKYVEYGLSFVSHQSPIKTSIVRKNIRNFLLYRDNLCFLSTSDMMEQHFVQDLRLSKEQFIRSVYPRNLIAHLGDEYKTFKTDTIQNRKLSDFDEVILFAPTYRDVATLGGIHLLVPEVEKLKELLIQKNALFIFKMHPQEYKRQDYIEFKKSYENFERFIFWEGEQDIYEIFDKITTAIVDYSSIFYDLLQAGVENFIRYIPDYQSYTSNRELKFDYFQYSGGTIAKSYDELLSALKNKNNPVDNRDFLLQSFFGFDDKTMSATDKLNDLVNKIQQFKKLGKSYPNLYSFDIFDTLICRTEVNPVSVFYAVQEKMRQSELDFDEYFTQNYPKIRQSAESVVRFNYKKTTFERNTHYLEINFNLIFEQLERVYHLNKKQVQFLKDQEIAIELNSVRPVSEMIDRLFQLHKEGNDIILVSDMYLDKAVIQNMLAKVNPDLLQFPLYLSSDLGVQKSTGDLYKHIFFDLNYQYKQWFHFGDNMVADHNVAKSLGIQPIHHNKNIFKELERYIINQFGNYEGYKIASMMNAKRWVFIKNHPYQIKEYYYFYAFIGSIVVPYVQWAVGDAISKGYKTIYFISRDGYYLKKIADIIIEHSHLDVKTKYIYGSRKAWRLAAQIDKIDEELFSGFGLFSSMDSYEDVISASQLSEEELLSLFPDFKSFAANETFRGKVAENIRQLFAQSSAYRQILLEKAKKQREIVCQYLKQEIDFNEQFTFIEFWGRGYTQVLLSRLLNFIRQDNSIKNSMYYMRSFYQETPNTVHYNYTVKTLDYAFVEPFFSHVPMRTVQSYEYSLDDHSVYPVYQKKDAPLSALIEDALSQFTLDYLDLNLSENAGRLLSDSVAQYHCSNYHDDYLISVFSNLTDNINSYGQEKVFAPSLDEMFKKTTHIKLLDLYTRNIALSVQKSSEQSVKKYTTLCAKQGVKPYSFKEIVNRFPYNDLHLYVLPKTFPAFVEILKNSTIYSSVDINPNTKINKYCPKGSIVQVEKIVWKHDGVPRLLIKDGFITAHIDFNKESTATKESLVVKEIKVYKEQPIVKKVVKAHKAVVKSPYSALGKVPVLRKVRFIFNEKHKVGRVLSYFVRKFF